MAGNDNRDIEDIQDQNQGGNQGGGGGGQDKNALLVYNFLPYYGASVFQLSKQHPAVTRFIEQLPGQYFQASNGINITLGILHPEWKESKNTIRLDGTGGINLKHVDITYFQTVFDSFNSLILSF